MNFNGIFFSLSCVSLFVFIFGVRFSTPNARYIFVALVILASISNKDVFYIQILLWMTPTSNKREIVGELGNQFAAIIICWPSIFGCDRRDHKWNPCAVFYCFTFVLFCSNVRHAACNHHSSYLNCLFDVC